MWLLQREGRELTHKGFPCSDFWENTTCVFIDEGPLRWKRVYSSVVKLAPACKRFLLGPMLPVRPPKEKEEAEGDADDRHSNFELMPDDPQAISRPPDWGAFPGDPANFKSSLVGPNNRWHCPFVGCSFSTVSKNSDVLHVNKCGLALLSELLDAHPGVPTSQLVELGKERVHPQYFDISCKAWCPECGKIVSRGAGRKPHKGINGKKKCTYTPPRLPKGKLSQAEGGANQIRPSSWIESRQPRDNPVDDGPPMPEVNNQLQNMDFSDLGNIPWLDIVRVARQARLVDVNGHRFHVDLAATWSNVLQETCVVIRSRNDAATWRLWFILAPCTLRMPNNMRHTRADWKRWEAEASMRLKRWQQGEIMALWRELCEDVARAPVPLESLDGQDNPAKKRRQVLRLIRLGRFSDAARALTAEAMAPLTEATIQTLQEKFPPAPAGVALPQPSPDLAAPSLTREQVRKCIMSFPRGSSAGLSGLGPDTLKLALSAALRAQKESDLLDSIMQLMSVLCCALAPQEVAPWLCGGRLVPVGAKVRPIVVSDTLARLCSKAMLGLQLDTTTHEHVFKGVQGGVGESGAIERTIHRLRKELQSHSQHDYAILQIDFRNGFNSVFRGPIMEELNKHTPLLARWFHWAHSLPLSLILPNGVALDAPNGTGQGDPASPAYFAMTLQPVLDQILDTWGETLGVCRAYLDDIIISGPVGVLTQVLEFLRNNPTVLQRGLTIRPDKCCIFMPNQGLVDGLRGQYDIPADIQLVTAAGGITALGVPIGANDYVERFLREVGESLRQFGNELEGLQHGQLELLLYTYSGGCKRIMHLFRCLPSEKLLPVADVCNQETMRLLQQMS
ncbi:MAG: reverse transcriptase domain-containing protein [Roseimicrobium sp.]